MMQVQATKTCEGTASFLLSQEAQEAVLLLNEHFSCGSHCAADCANVSPETPTTRV